MTEMGNGNIYGLIDGGKQMNRMDVMARSLAAAAGGKSGCNAEGTDR